MKRQLPFELVYQISALVVALIIVHLVYITLIRPNAAAIAEVQAEQIAAGNVVDEEQPSGGAGLELHHDALRRRGKPRECWLVKQVRVSALGNGDCLDGREWAAVYINFDPNHISGSELCGLGPVSQAHARRIGGHGDGALRGRLPQMFPAKPKMFLSRAS